MYSYAASYKPFKKMGLAAMYLSYVPFYSLDMLYMVKSIKIVQ